LIDLSPGTWETQAEDVAQVDVVSIDADKYEVGDDGAVSAPSAVHGLFMSGSKPPY